VVVAVRAFQARHGLAADGVIGRETVAQLEVSPARRVRQIVLGLERLRWTPRLRAPRSIVVNVPEFMLRAYTLEGGAATLALQMRVIVGKALDTRTPLFAEDMRFIEFSPYWNVPPSIAQAELVPKLQRSPGYLPARVSSSSMATATLHDAGPGPAGRGAARPAAHPPAAGAEERAGGHQVRVPNDDNIYLHHTPRRGCLRASGGISATAASASRRRWRWRASCWRACPVGRGAHPRGDGAGQLEHPAPA
jgi:murein L,D-transpeptidase YcbB/YkuD